VEATEDPKSCCEGCGKKRRDEVQKYGARGKIQAVIRALGVNTMSWFVL